jgi:hypothetical protein
MGFGFSLESGHPESPIPFQQVRQKPRFRFRGIYIAEAVWAHKPDEVLWREVAENGITDAGINDNESVYFGAGTQKTAWYFLLINNASFTALAAADTMSSHAGWVESVDYSESTRQQWLCGAPASRVITNSTSATFTINTTVTIKGAALTSSNTKSGTSGILWSTGLFATAQSMVNGQLLKLTYTLTGTAS